MTKMNGGDQTAEGLASVAAAILECTAHVIVMKHQSAF
jgi:hypothetical protein